MLAMVRLSMQAHCPFFVLCVLRSVVLISLFRSVVLICCLLDYCVFELWFWFAVKLYNNPIFLVYKLFTVIGVRWQIVFASR